MSEKQFPGEGRALGGSSQNQASTGAGAQGNPPKKLTDPFQKEHFEAVIKQLDVDTIWRLFGVLRGLSHQDVSHQLQSVGGGVSVFIQAKNVLTAVIRKKGITRQSIVTALVDSEFNLSADNLKVFWKDSLDKPCNPQDIETIIDEGELAWNGLHKMFSKLGLKDSQIEIYRDGQTATVEQKAEKVFTKWIQKAKPRPDIKELFDDLIQVDNLNAAQVLAKNWGLPIPEKGV